ncbi:MAG: polysaccharide biosynthesis protein [Syntrophales bacterium]
MNTPSAPEKTIRPVGNRIFYDLTHTSSLSRFLYFFFCDVFIVTLSLYLSFLVHFDFTFQVPYLELIREVLFFFVALKIGFLLIFRIYNVTWRYVGVADLMNIVLAVVVAQMVLLILSMPNAFFQLPITGLGKRIFLVDGFFTLVFISGLRISKKVYLDLIREKRAGRKGKRTLIIGAGNAGDMLLRDIARRGFADFLPIGLLDDDREKAGMLMHGVKVLGKLGNLEEVIAREQVEAVIIAIPSLTHKTLLELYNSARKSKVSTVKVIPRIYDFDKPDIKLKGLEDIGIEDLIGRQIIPVDFRSIRHFLEGKSVLITGAGGSIGMEIVMQVCTFGPRRIVLFDIDETELHNLGLRLTRLFSHLSGEIEYVTGDVRDELRVQEVFVKYKPEIIFHAAAYKHVPMMEYNPREAAKVNIFGTYNIARAAVESGTETFVMISTDKAVRPTSVMGATKRMAEFICRTFNELNRDSSLLFPQSSCPDNRGHEDNRGHDPNSPEFGIVSPIIPPLVPPQNAKLQDLTRIPPATRFMSVRFGNVLGSRGSVLPLFLEQLKHGGPLTVTDPEMKRYFMTIPEAVSLVLQASTLGQGGEVFVLDMGEPVKIVHIAEELIRLHGMEPNRDIDIRFTGLRPGEKLFEEILTAEEGTDASCHEKIFVARNSLKYTLPELSSILSEFSEAIRDPSADSDEKMKQLLRKHVKHYTQE